jgi:hypothetical protein
MPTRGRRPTASFSVGAGPRAWRAGGLGLSGLPSSALQVGRRGPGPDSESDPKIIGVMPVGADAATQRPRPGAGARAETGPRAAFGGPGREGSRSPQAAGEGRRGSGFPESPAPATGTGRLASARTRPDGPDATRVPWARYLLDALPRQAARIQPGFPLPVPILQHLRARGLIKREPLRN